MDWPGMFPRESQVRITRGGPTTTIISNWPAVVATFRSNKVYIGICIYIYTCVYVRECVCVYVRVSVCMCVVSFAKVLYQNKACCQKITSKMKLLFKRDPAVEGALFL